MLVLSALIVPCGLLVLMMAMQQVQERLLPPGGPVLTVATEPPAGGVMTGEAMTAGSMTAEEPQPVVVVIPAQATYEPSKSVVGSASLTSASPSR